MIEILKTSPCYLTTNQRIIRELVTHPVTHTPHLAFRNPSLKAIGEFGSFERELPVLLLGALQ